MSKLHIYATEFIFYKFLLIVLSNG